MSLQPSLPVPLRDHSPVDDHGLTGYETGLADKPVGNFGDICGKGNSTEGGSLAKAIDVLLVPFDPAGLYDSRRDAVDPDFRCHHAGKRLGDADCRGLGSCIGD